MAVFNDFKFKEAVIAMKTVSISNDQFRSYFLSFHFVVHFCLLNEDFYMELYCLKNVADSIGA